MRLSLKRDIIGKSDYTSLGYGWETVELNTEDLARLTYFEGRAIASGVFRDGVKDNAHWLSSELIVLDFDEFDTPTTFTDIVNDSFVKRHAAIVYPSSSFTPERPKAHAVFTLNRPLDDATLYRKVVRWVAERITLKTDAATAKPSQAIFGTRFTQGDYDKNEYFFTQDVAPLNVTAILTDVLRTESILDNDNGDSRRHNRHTQQSYDVQTNVTCEALDFALKGWGRKTYDEWLALIMSAYAGSSATDVRDTILNHPDIDWTRSEREALIQWWSTFQLKPDGYTVATLFMLARRNGWLQRTSVDIDDEDVQEFYAKEVSEFLVPLDVKHALVMSNTGTGKTLGAIAKLKALGTPKSVFFAPSIRLCMALSATLTAHGVTNTLYIDNGKTLSGDTLKEAHVLVTTLQTFANKLYARVNDLSEYKFVVIDESDELISAFSRGGSAWGGASHVKKHESKWGMLSLSRMFNVCEYVYLLDATATRITVETYEQMTGRKLPVYRNTFKREKAPITMLPTLNDARAMIVNAVEIGKRVVVATDTRKEAETIETYLKLARLVQPSDVITITGETHYNSRVRDFFKDVEASARKYQVVIYNSAMGSGVSIVDTKPDVIVQIMKYIPPRKNLQILNRFRVQGDVYCYVRPTESLYIEPLDERLTRLDRLIESETTLTGLDYARREHVAKVTTNVATLALQDENEQRRNVKQFYRGLLESDGRTIKVADNIAPSVFAEQFNAAVELLKDRNEQVLERWPDFAAITRDNPPVLDAYPFDVACGLLHAHVINVLPNWERLNLEPSDTARLALRFGRYVWFVENMVRFQGAIARTAKDLASGGRASVKVRAIMSRQELIQLTGDLFDDERYALDEQTFESKAGPYLRQVELRRPVYDSMVRAATKRLDTVYDKYATAVERAYFIARYVLQTIGLNVKRRNGKMVKGERLRECYIDGIDELNAVMRNRGYNGLTFDPDTFAQELVTLRDNAKTFNALDDDEKREVITLADIDGFEEAINGISQYF